MQTLAIDCHCHAVSANYLRTLAGFDGRDVAVLRARQVFSAPSDSQRALVERLTGSRSMSERIAAMDASGVVLQVLSNSAPYPWCSDPGWAAVLARAWNDGAAAIADGHRGRFAVFASLPWPHLGPMLEETERAMATPSTVGVAMTAHIQGVPIDDRRWYPLYEAWDAASVTAFVHPDGFCVNGVLDDYHMTWDLGPVFDDTIAAVRLYSSGILKTFPNIRWVVPHLGGTLPVVLGRLDRHWERDSASREEPLAPSEMLGGLWFDIAGHDGLPIRLAAETLGLERLIFGSDYPMVTEDDMAFSVGALAASGLRDDESYRVMRSNVETVLPRLGHVLSFPSRP